VAHVGQKLALGQVGRLGLQPGQVELLRALVHQAFQLAVGIGQAEVPGLDLRQHGIEAVHQVSRLVQAALLNPQGVVLLVAHPAGCGSQLVDRGDDAADYPEADHHGHQEGQQHACG